MCNTSAHVKSGKNMHNMQFFSPLSSGFLCSISALLLFGKCRAELCCLSFSLFHSFPCWIIALSATAPLPTPSLELNFCGWNHSKQKWDLFPGPEWAGNSGPRKPLAWLARGTWNLELLALGPFCIWEPDRVWFGSALLGLWRPLKKSACKVKLIISQVTSGRVRLSFLPRWLFPPSYFLRFALRYERWGCL